MSNDGNPLQAVRRVFESSRQRRKLHRRLAASWEASVQVFILEESEQVQRQCPKVETTVDDRSDTRRYESVDFADVGSRGVEHVVDADVPHEVERHHEVAEDTLDRGHRGEDGIVEVIHVVKDRHSFCEHLLRCHKDVGLPDPGTV